MMEKLRYKLIVNDGDDSVEWCIHGWMQYIGDIKKVQLISEENVIFAILFDWNEFDRNVDYWNKTCIFDGDFKYSADEFLKFVNNSKIQKVVNECKFEFLPLTCIELGIINTMENL